VVTSYLADSTYHIEIVIVPTVTTMSHYFTVKRILFDIISDLAVGYRNCNILDRKTGKM
jgi:hypothetical protein